MNLPAKKCLLYMSNLFFIKKSRRHFINLKFVVGWSAVWCKDDSVIVSATVLGSIPTRGTDIVVIFFCSLC